ncbi:blue copper protein 1a-like [Typha latifolia]|uniref:blue copper protein 1a-like n=1 Tax=Typha latifolia TaxID=4733 RepID=UPI003C2CF52C
MASKQIPVVLTVIFAVLLAIARATDYVVGDEKGWGLEVNYTSWAENKEFRVGDTILFSYASGAHNVIEVGGPDFRACNVPQPAAANALTSGSDVITLTSTGRRWFLCGKEGHCQKGQKILIPIREALASPPPMPPPTNGGVVGFPFQALMVAVTAMAVVMLAMI